MSLPELKPVLEPIQEAPPTIEPITDYPLDALGPLAPVARLIAQKIQAPPGIAAHSVLGCAALAAQQVADVQLDGLRSPVSLFLICIAGSGDRKSACDKEALRPVYEHAKNLNITYKHDLKAYQDELAIYKSRKAEVLRENPDGLSDLDVPEMPPEPTLLQQEPTLEAMQKALRYGQPSQGLFNDEAGQLFGGHAFDDKHALKTIAGLSKIWGGDPIYRTRAGTGESLAIENRRMSVNLMMQPIVAGQVIGSELLEGQGFLARMLVADTVTLAGTRMYAAFNLAEEPEYQAYYRRILGLLTDGYALDQNGGLELNALQFTESARVLMISFCNQAEKLQADEEGLALIRPFASKIAEQARRLAGVMAVYGGEAVISEATTLNAIKLANYYVQIALRAKANAAIDAELLMATEFANWLQSRPEDVFELDWLSTRTPPRFNLRGNVGRVRALMGCLVIEGLAYQSGETTKGKPAEWKLTDGS